MPSHQSAIYQVSYNRAGASYLIYNTGGRGGMVKADGNKITKIKELGNKTSLYIYAETDVTPVKTGVPIRNGSINWGAAAAGSPALLTLTGLKASAIMT
ncbi:MAG: hypothetical protein ACOH2A_08700 [Sphingobacteriaceae bacterium]